MWWENKGKQRAIALRRRKPGQDNIRKRTVLFIWILALVAIIGLYFNWSLISAVELGSDKETQSADEDFDSKNDCKFRDAVDGYIGGCVNGCQSFSTLSGAKNSCVKIEECTGITRIPWLPSSEQYQLRSGSQLFPSLDGQISYVISGCHNINAKNSLEKQMHVDRAEDNEPESDGEEKLNQGENEDSIEENGEEKGEDTENSSEDGASSGLADFSDIDEYILSKVDWRRDIQFWDLPHDYEENYHKYGTFIDGDPSLYVGIASYRDPMCHETIDRIFQLAKRPHRVFVGVVEQNANGDIPCLHVQRSCKTDPEQNLCKYAEQIRVMRLDARDAMGPTWGRHRCVVFLLVLNIYRADSLYQNEYFALQIDAHMFFIRDWDDDMISQWKSAKNENAVLSTYPSDSRNALDEFGNSKFHTTPIMCNTMLLGNYMTKHTSAIEIRPKPGVNTPILQVWWAAGISFSRGHRVARVPYDCCLPMLFDGEETSMAYRMWTSGYDFYTFHHSAVFHPYSRPKPPHLFWENNDKHPGALQKAVSRLLRIYGLDTDDIQIDETDLDRYGLGNSPGRPLEKFLSIFGISYNEKTVRNNCKAVQTYMMHRALTPYIREDGKGIDYSKVPDDIYKNDFKIASKESASRRGNYAKLSDAVGFGRSHTWLRGN